MANADFNDGKEAAALRTIGEVSEALGIKTHVLRYWEQQFDLLNPLKRSGGRRYYRPGDVEMIQTINQLVNIEGYTLKGANAALSSTDRREGDRRKVDRRQMDAALSSEEADGKDALLTEVLPDLKDIRSRLATLLDA